MSKRNFLSTFINEEIYLVDQMQEQSISAKSPVIEKCLCVVPGTLSAADTRFLHKVFAAVDIDPQMLEVAERPESSGPVRAIFYFGVSPQDQTYDYYQYHQVEGKPVINAHSLAEIAGDNDLKRKLWSALKACFN